LRRVSSFRLLGRLQFVFRISCLPVCGQFFRLRAKMATKLIANLIVMGSGVVLRALSQAYRQAIVNASKTGVAQETVQNMAHKVSKTMTEHEARQILGVAETAPWEDVLMKYETLFENNTKAGSFYLQSKVFRAKECLEAARERNSSKSEEVSGQ